MEALAIACQPNPYDVFVESVQSPKLAFHVLCSLDCTYPILAVPAVKSIFCLHFPRNTDTTTYEELPEIFQKALYVNGNV